jgi:hypothetical protein
MLFLKAVVIYICSSEFMLLLLSLVLDDALVFYVGQAFVLLGSALVAGLTMGTQNKEKE